MIDERHQSTSLDIHEAAESVDDLILEQLADTLPTVASDGHADLAPDIKAVAYAHLAAPPHMQYSTRHLSHKTGLSAQKIKFILSTKEFENAVSTALNAATKRQVSAIHKTLYMKALGGSPAHMKMFLERFDRPELAEDLGVNPHAIIEFLRIKARLTPKQVAALLAGKADVVLIDATE